MALEKVIGPMAKAGLRWNPKKCKLLIREIMFLGYLINAHGIKAKQSASQISEICQAIEATQ